MRAYLPAFDLRAAASVEEAINLLASSSSGPGGWRPFAGGTDLMVHLEAGSLLEGCYVGLWKITELRGIRDLGETIEIGALTTYTDLLNSEAVQRHCPLLCRAAAETGGVATQNRGTIGGNIANASPAADSPPVLLVYDAELELMSVRGTRRVPYDRFHLGYKKMDLAPDELIVRIRVPKRARGWTEYYRKVGTRRAQAISKVCLAAALQRSAETGIVTDVRIAFGSVAPTVVRARTAEAALRARPLDDVSIAAARRALADDIAPIDDIRSTARYRLRVAERVLTEFLVATMSRT